MRIRRKWLRDIASIVFTIYYLIAAEQADEKVRKVRGMLTVDHLRVSWNKGTTPYLKFIQNLMRPRLMRYPPRAIRIPRPSHSDYNEPVHAWLYFDGPLSELKSQTNLVLDVPGGGYVAMSPRSHDDKLIGWAGKTGLPILSLDYRKAPEYPYPYALNECFDVYRTIIASRGRCVGMSGEQNPQVVVTGDSAGGNLATGLVIMIIESGSTDQRQFQGQTPLPIPEGLILAYPSLDMNIGSWMSDEEMSLIKDRRMRKTNKNILRRKDMHYTLAAGTPHQSDQDDYFSPKSETSPPPTEEAVAQDTPLKAAAQLEHRPPTTVPNHTRRPSGSHHYEPLKTRLAMSSMISYFNDRILSPEMMRAMIILYIGPHNRPDFTQDYLLSPVLAPDTVLSQFPKTYFVTGERDPLVDDTVIFAGRLRRAKHAKHEAELAGQVQLVKEFDDRDVVEVTLIPGISHGFFQFVSAFPEGWKHIFRCARWIDTIFAETEQKELNRQLMSPGGNLMRIDGFGHKRRAESSGEEDMGLEISMSSSRKAKAKEMEKDEQRRKKERLIREEMDKRRAAKQNGLSKRQKSMVSLASTEDLVGRRMLGLAGPLTGRGYSDGVDL
jgi:acetyl esterase/lipase